MDYSVCFTDWVAVIFNTGPEEGNGYALSNINGTGPSTKVCLPKRNEEVWENWEAVIED